MLEQSWRGGGEAGCQICLYSGSHWFTVRGSGLVEDRLVATVRHIHTNSPVEARGSLEDV